MNYFAAEAFVGHSDGYWTGGHNYFVYHEPSQDQWTWIPWGLDQAFNTPVDAVGGFGYLQRRCYASKRCFAQYIEALERVARRVKGLGLAEQLFAQAKRIEEAQRNRLSFSLSESRGEEAGSKSSCDGWTSEAMRLRLISESFASVFSGTDLATKQSTTCVGLRSKEPLNR